MKPHLYFISLFRIGLCFLPFLLFGCKRSNVSVQEGKLFKDLPVVATKKGDLTVADLSKIKENVSLPLSTFTEELVILKLDDDGDALVSPTKTKLSDNYILVMGRNSIPFKLFSKQSGKFLANIGAFGQGPGEYQFVYDFQLDEKNDRVYLLPWNARNILSYDLKGKFIGTIPLCFNLPKGKFHIDSENNRLTVVALPFTGIEAVTWTQDLEGKLIHSVEPGHLTIQPDFSNEVYGGKVGNTFSLSIFTFGPRLDSLYNYGNEKMTPVFTLDFKGKEPSIHSYSETTKYFLGQLSEPKKINDQTTRTQNNMFFIIDKNTLGGTFFELKNDFLGDLLIEWPTGYFEEDYFCQNMDPGLLKTQLEETLKNPDLTSEVIAKVKELIGSISDNDNNYILYAKWK